MSGKLEVLLLLCFELIGLAFLAGAAILLGVDGLGWLHRGVWTSTTVWASPSRTERQTVPENPPECPAGRTLER